MALHYDLISRVLEICHNDYDFLLSCSLVNSEFNRAASRKLYSRVVISPTFQPVLNLRDTDSIPEKSNFSSALLPRNAPYVRSLEVSGFVSPRAPPRNTLPDSIASAIKLFVNICNIHFTPVTYHEDLFTTTIPALRELKSLTRLTVNSSCTDEARAPALVELRGLRELTIISPGRAILQLLPDWLAQLSPNLLELHLMANCGSVTPGVLKSLLPHVQDALQAVTLGLSYSLTNEDVFAFLGQLPAIKRVRLHYYWIKTIVEQQFKNASRQPKLSTLKSLTVTYNHIQITPEATDFDKWVRRAITGSPDLEELRLIPNAPTDDTPEGLSPNDTGAHVAHDALVEHIFKKHAEKIRVLDLGSAYVSKGALKSLFASCHALEEVDLWVGSTVLSILLDLADTLPHLYAASFQICNVKRNYQVENGLIAETMRNGPPSLRKLKVNGTLWQGLWKVDRNINAEFVVEQAKEFKPPWAMEVKN